MFSLALENGNNTDGQLFISSFQFMLFQGCIIHMLFQGCIIQMVFQGCIIQMVFQGCIINTPRSKGLLSIHGVPRVYY